MLITKILFVGLWVMNMTFMYGIEAVIMKRRFSKAVTALVATLVCAGIIAFRYWLLVGGGEAKVPAGSTFTTIAMLSLQILLYYGVWYKQLMNFFLIGIFSMIPEVLCAFLAEKIAGSMNTFNFADLGFRYGTMLYYPLFALIVYPTIKLMKKVNRLYDNTTGNGYIWLVVMFPISQLLLFYLYTGVTVVARPLSLVGILVGCVADVILIVLLEKDHKRYALLKDLEAEKQLLANEEEAYWNLMLQQEEIAQIRHDYQNQLMALKALK